MPYKYIGRTTDFKGKTLWEILGNLKDFGVGRIIGRNMFQRYKEPCYVKILKVEALPNPSKPSYDEQRKVIALVERTFRGIKYNKLVQMESASYKADYFLVPKSKETAFCSEKEQLSTKIFPSEMELPGLLKELVIHQSRLSGSPLKKDPKMKIKYNKTGLKRYRVAEEGETPTEPVPSIGLGKPHAPRLYENIKL